MGRGRAAAQENPRRIQSYGLDGPAAAEAGVAVLVAEGAGEGLALGGADREREREGKGVLPRLDDAFRTELDLQCGGAELASQAAATCQLTLSLGQRQRGHAAPSCRALSLKNESFSSYSFSWCVWPTSRCPPSPSSS